MLEYNITSTSHYPHIYLINPIMLNQKQKQNPNTNSTITPPLEYIPFQSLNKVKIYQILKYGRQYDNYTHYRITENPEFITDLYVDAEPYTMFNPDGSVPMVIDESRLPYQVEIHYCAESKKPMKPCILAKADIDMLIAKYGCKL